MDEEEQHYRSTEQYTINNVTDPMSGQPLVQVLDSTGMIRAILNPTDFAKQFELIPV